MGMEWESLFRRTCLVIFPMFLVVTVHAQTSSRIEDKPIVGSQPSSQEQRDDPQQPSTSQPADINQECSKPHAVSANTPSLNLFSFRSLKMLPGQLIQDQKTIWESPAKIRKKQLLWFVPFSAATAALLITDERTNREVQESPGLQAPSNGVSRFGGTSATLGIVGAFALFGQVGHSDRARQAGFVGLEALIDSAVVGGLIKVISERSRPTQNNGEGQFFSGGSSFPSGHAITTWALATVIAEEYPDKPLLRYGAWGWATAISLSRIGGQHHFPSDVLVGSTFGYLIGRYVAHSKSAKALTRHSVCVLPYFDHSVQEYGVSASMRF